MLNTYIHPILNSVSKRFLFTMTHCSVEKERLLLTFQHSTLTTTFGTENLNASEHCQRQLPLKRDVADLEIWHSFLGGNGWTLRLYLIHQYLKKKCTLMNFDFKANSNKCVFKATLYIQGPILVWRGQCKMYR